MRTIETKVIAAAAGSGGGAAVASFALWLLGVALWGAPSAADHAGDAVAAVPSPVAVLIGVILTAVGGFATGYAAPHTDRARGAAPDTAAGSDATEDVGRHAADDTTHDAGPGALPPTDDLNTEDYGFASASAPDAAPDPTAHTDTEATA